ncbi:sugar phosphate isomerase/epimerase family protein [Methanolapillus millepedarum]|uniref:Endonuclease 4 n=1 Tax=Methanolapillus millepedarum TaxID=3028296 RepID=A0AA96V5N6_9EURY|nr:endonuclease 4 [Methanosarcinaceae archaeon Ac7]
MIGVSTLALFDKDLDFALSEIEQFAGFAEIFSEGKHDIVADFKNNPNYECLFSHNLSYSVHAPTQDVNLASLREEIRRAGLEIISQSARVCQEIDANILVVHPGYMPQNSTGLYESSQAALLKSLRQLAEIRKETGVNICVENMPNAEIFLFRYPDEINLEEEDLSFVLDIGHAHTTNTLDAFLNRRVNHYHIHDNDGKSDLHLAFGDGNIGDLMLNKIIQKSKKENSMLIAENKTIHDAKKTFKILNSKIRQIL